MHARVATFEGAEPEQVRQMAEGIREQATAGLPEEVPAAGLLLLTSSEQRKVVAIALFETAEDLAKGHATLSAIDPPIPGGFGRRTSVELYEVGLRIDL